MCTVPRISWRAESVQINPVLTLQPQCVRHSCDMRVRRVVRAVASSIQTAHQQTVGRHSVNIMQAEQGNTVSRFEGVLNTYKGVTVESDKEHCAAHLLAEKLSVSLQDWRMEGVRTVWFLVSPSHSDWVPLLVAQGFTFHHANKDRLALMLWLGETELRDISLVFNLNLFQTALRSVMCLAMPIHWLVWGAWWSRTTTRSWSCRRGSDSPRTGSCQEVMLIPGRTFTMPL